MASSTSFEASRNPFTITRWILQEQQKYPSAKGDLTIILNSITLAVKIISAAAKGAGIFQRYGVERLKEEITSLPRDSIPHLQHKSISEMIDDGDMNEENPEKKEKDDIDPFEYIGDDNDEKEKIKDSAGIREFAYDSIYSSIAWCGKIPLMISTLNTSKPINVTECDEPKYILYFDPIDGKQNIEINVSLGTIFGIYKVKDTTKPSLTDCLQSGSELVCGGYALYGDATVVMLTFGDEVNGFTLDPTIGEFVLTHKNVRCPEEGHVYSINEGYAEDWNDAVKEYIAKCKKPEKGKPWKSRYIGCMVADVHRTIIRGGIFMYPANKKFPDGKLNLQCECNPLAFVVKAAGGRASNGTHDILNIKPKGTNQTTPIFIGSKKSVMALEVSYKTNKINM